VIGSHQIFSAYGFWLPNDPRGSCSDFVRKFEIFRLGRATRTGERRSVAKLEHDRELRKRAKEELRYPPVTFDGIQARAIGRGFAEYAARSKIIVWACSILPDHVHMVLGPMKIDIERAVGQFKAAATRQLIAEGLHPFAAYAKEGQTPPCCWARKGWTVFLDDVEDACHSIDYVEQNPVKEGKPQQRWSFVVPFVSGSPEESAG